MTMTDIPAAGHRGAWSVEKLLQRPDDGNRYEIAHGSLLVTPSPSFRRVAVTDRLGKLMDRKTPEGFLSTIAGIGVDLGDIPGGRSYYIPDLVVIRVEVLNGEGPTLGPQDVLLAVEVLSPSNAGNDLMLKRRDYAAAGIPTYWIVDPAARTLTVLEHDGKDRYREAATIKAGETWKTDRPFDLEIDPADFT